MQITSKLPHVGTNIFSVMSKLAVDYQSINLGQGFPDFNPDPELLKLVNKAMEEGYNQYPLMTGIPALREVVREKIKVLYGHNYDADKEITITSGATEAIMSTIISVINTGDEVVVLEPCYDSYLPAILLAGGKPVCVPMNSPTLTKPQFSVDWDLVEKNISSKAKMILLNFPHNPTGAVLTDDDLDEIERITKKYNLLILSDEVYEHIIFDGAKHKSLSTRPALVERCFLISSFGKTTHTTGWKVGYCCAPETLTKELRKIHQFVVFTVPSPFQHALAKYTLNSSTYQNLPNFYQEKRNYLANGLKQTRFKALPSYGTFFMLADYSEISKLPEAEFSIWLTKEHGVTVIPVSAFYGEPDAPSSNHHIIRFCFAKQQSTLDNAIERLMKV
jgi:methionine aminotransferase